MRPRGVEKQSHRRHARCHRNPGSARATAPRHDGLPRPVPVAAQPRATRMADVEVRMPMVLQVLDRLRETCAAGRQARAADDDTRRQSTVPTSRNHNAHRLP
jgi:hypothetical protein